MVGDGQQDGPSDETQGSEDEAEQILELESLDPEVKQRCWVQVITGLIEQRSQASDPSPRVQLALDRLFIAACERGVRAFHHDLKRDDADPTA